MKRIFIFCICIIIITSCVSVSRKNNVFRNGRLIINGREVFLSGMNLAWLHFGKDLVEFDEPMFIKALDDVARAGGIVSGGGFMSMVVLRLYIL